MNQETADGRQPKSRPVTGAEGTGRLLFGERCSPSRNGLRESESEESHCEIGSKADGESSERSRLPPSGCEGGTNGAHSRPLCIELFAGLHGWGEGLAAEGWRSIGFDIVDMCSELGKPRPKWCELVLQDVLTLDGGQFAGADLIVASPPCQEFSYMAMPWSRAKQIAGALRGQLPFPAEYRGSRTVAELTALFDACFRIQREASEAAGRRIPMVVENVRGAIPWVGPAKARFGSYFLWGDVAMVGSRIIANHGIPQFGQMALAAPGKGAKQPGRNFHFPEKYGIPSPSFQGADHESYVREALALKNSGSNTWFGIQSNGDRYPGQTGQPVRNAGVKNGNDWFSAGEGCSLQRKASSRSAARKHASAVIAKIPEPLSRHVARIFRS